MDDDNRFVTNQQKLVSVFGKIANKELVTEVLVTAQFTHEHEKILKL